MTSGWDKNLSGVTDLWFNSDSCSEQAGRDLCSQERSGIWAEALSEQGFPWSLWPGEGNVPDRVQLWLEVTYLAATFYLCKYVPWLYLALEQNREMWHHQVIRKEKREARISVNRASHSQKGSLLQLHAKLDGKRKEWFPSCMCVVKDSLSISLLKLSGCHAYK